MLRFFNLLLLFIFVSGIKSDTITKDDVLKLKPEKCIEDKECAHTKSKLCFDGFCRRVFYCHNNECIEEENKGMSHEYYITKDNYQDYSNTTDLILESCPEKARNIEKCFTRSCSKDNDCYSNKCLNNTCIENTSFTTNVCRLNIKLAKMYCTKPYLESCQNDNECDSGYCNEYNFCADKRNNDLFYGLLIVRIFEILFIIIIVVLVILCIMRCNKKKISK